MFVNRAQRMFVFCAVLLLASALPVRSQVPETQKRYIRVGALQSRFTAYGSERAWNDVYYEGLTWPSDYQNQDNAVIERQWIGCQDFTDAKSQHWENYGVNFAQTFAGISVFPMVHKQTSKFDLPIVYVDGNDVNAPYRSEIDEIDPNQIPDRIVTNVVNTSMGVTMTRRILAFSQQYHDNYFIKEYTFKNTGYVNATTNKVLNATVKGFRFGFGVRYSVSREGDMRIGDGQSYGKHTWVTRRGEDYPQHANDVLTESSPIPQWLRAGYCWAGQSTVNTFDNIGGPYRAAGGDGRLCAVQFAGIVTLHVDKSATDKSDDPLQPNTLGWHAGDTYPALGDMGLGTLPFHVDLYKMLSGVPYKGLGSPSERMDEVYMATKVDPWQVHNDGGGTNLWINYGPFDLAPGDSVVIVMAEGVAGLNRETAQKVGSRWKLAYDNASDNGPFTLPDGSSTTNKDTYKDKWVYTGRDSIMLTFSRAKRNYDAGYNIPQPPQPPPMVNIVSGGDRITLDWAPSPSQNTPGFGGYKIFRAVGKPDTTYQEIASLGPDASRFEDVTPQRGFSYYYYVSAFTTGGNSTGAANPAGTLMSSRFYTKTNQPAYLRRKAGESIKSIRIVPNPYNIAARDLQFTGEPDKIMFLNIPGHCTINIYTENGELINTISHEDGSGDHAWNSVTSSRQVVVSGIYIVHFTVTQDYTDPKTGQGYKKGDTAVQKLVIIR